MVFLIQIKEKKMKKNFLKIAALLIAAMLLVVSCSQEVKAPENDDNGPVAVTLNTSVASKGLTFGGLEALDELTYKFYLDALWDDTNLDEKIVGENVTTGKTFTGTSNIDLGYLSQGYWNIRVEAKKGETVVLSGETNQYITNNNSSVTVFLNIAGNDSSAGSKLTFNINVNDLAAGNNGYTLHYSIDGADYKGGEPAVKRGVISTKTQNGNNITNFAGSTPDNNKLKPGYYRVTVALKNGESVIGAITRGFLLIDGVTEVTINGSVSASVFEKSTLNIFTAEVNISNVTAIVKDTTTNLLPSTASSAGLYASSVTCGSDNKVTVVYSLSPNLLNIEKDKNGVTEVSGPTYSWMVDGVEKSTNPTLEIEYTPGNRYVTCIVTYTYKCKVGESEGEFPVSAEAYTYLQVYENGYVAPSN